MDIMQESLAFHKELKGKIEIKNKMKLNTMKDMTLAYTPGVASACLSIKEDPKQVYELTTKHNTVAVISDGTAVLGLGDIGPLAAMPVMEGKCAIFKRFANINAIPIVLNTKDIDELVQTIYHLSPSFGGINLEDISAPRCFEVERRLKALCDIPVFHDDQHGTAIVAGAALLNALKIVNKKLNKVQITINGAGSAGIAITKFLLELGAKHITVCDRFGIIYDKHPDLNSAQQEIAKLTNKKHLKGSLTDALKGADVFIGVSAGNIVTKEMISSMNSDAIVFPLANPIPEISRDLALLAGARVVGTGASNLPNQINNALVFPGLFRGALDSGAKQITTKMQIAACHALSKIVSKKDLKETYIIPSIFDKRVLKHISKAVMNASTL
jgi:malate dehydrogenase (oxaloacetate-decarboxylating)